MDGWTGKRSSEIRRTTTPIANVHLRNPFGVRVYGAENKGICATGAHTGRMVSSTTNFSPNDKLKDLYRGCRELDRVK